MLFIGPLKNLIIIIFLLLNYYWWFVNLAVQHKITIIMLPAMRKGPFGEDGSMSNLYVQLAFYKCRSEYTQSMDTNIEWITLQYIPPYKQQS